VTGLVPSTEIERQLVCPVRFPSPVLMRCGLEAQRILTRDSVDRNTAVLNAPQLIEVTSQEGYRRNSLILFNRLHL
jgi:hypothetical protein